MKDTDLPFVGLHAHSTFSLNDGFGYPQEHQEFAYENGMDALALTDHGTCAGLSYAILNAKKMREEGRKFKAILGVEAYFIADVEEWRTTRITSTAAQEWTSTSFANTAKGLYAPPLACLDLCLVCGGSIVKKEMKLFRQQ